MQSIAVPVSASLLALSLLALPSAARAEPAHASLLPALTLTGEALAPSAFPLLRSPSGPTALPGLGSENRPLPMEVDPGDKVWRSIQLVCSDDGAALATVYLFNQALGTYKTGTEYWYVDRDNLSRLDRVGVNITVTDSSSTTPPSDPGYSSEQKMQLLDKLSWGSGWTTDPVSGGNLYAGPSNYYLRIKLSTTTPPYITNVTWYQVLASGSPANIDPAGSWTNDGSGSVPVPSGSTGYDISQNDG